MSGAFKHLKMSKIDSKLLRSKFRGSLLGSLLGDCLGAPYEGEPVSSGDKIIIQRYFDGLESPELKGPIRQYTDDTAMMKSVAQCLISNPEVDYSHMAKLFVKEYFNEPYRGYGQNVVEVFTKLRKNKFANIYKPASEQFGGSGSYGNGGAMRIAPVALRFYNNYEAMNETVQKSTFITHSNPLGVHGAILQCMAIQQSLHCDPGSPIDVQQFCEDLYEKMKEVEKENDDGLGIVHDSKPYQNKIRVIQELLNAQMECDEFDDKVVEKLGNSISAYQSVPTAIFCFLRAFNKLPAVQTDNIFRRTIQYAITLGGDTDTIACMAGAIAGAYLGEESINKNLIKQCEFHEEVIQMANEIYNICENMDDSRD